jgi:hypothetical protein
LNRAIETFADANNFDIIAKIYFLGGARLGLVEYCKGCK